MVRHVLEALAAEVVGDAHAQALEAVEHVELRDRQLRERVEPHRLAQHHQIEPARAAAASRVGAVLATYVHQVVADLVEQLGAERP